MTDTTPPPPAATATATAAAAAAVPAVADVSPPRPPRWRHVLNGVVLMGILVAAGVVVHTTPSEAVWQGPIAVEGTVGQTLTGRNIEATIGAVRVADRVTTSNGWSGETSGVYVVVDASVSAVVTDFAGLLGTAQVKIGDTVYGASDRPGSSTLQSTSLSVGLPKTGPLVFEIPRSALASDDARRAEVQLAINADPRTDSMIVVPVDLSSLPVESAITTDAPVWGAR